MNEPLAYLLTWTCYGTWLHGDARGSVEPGQNIPGTETLAPDSGRQRFAAHRMKTPAWQLDGPARKIVQRTLVDHAKLRGWELLALSARSRHVHVVVAYTAAPPEKMMAKLKAWSTRRLREQGYAAADTRVWTRHGSTRYLWNAPSLNGAVAYVLEGQDAPR